MDGFGLNKQARGESERALEAREEMEESGPLDPEFPYRVVSFPAGFFGVRVSVGDGNVDTSG